MNASAIKNLRAIFKNSLTVKGSYNLKEFWNITCSINVWLLELSCDYSLIISLKLRNVCALIALQRKFKKLTINLPALSQSQRSKNKDWGLTKFKANVFPFYAFPFYKRWHTSFFSIWILFKRILFKTIVHAIMMPTPGSYLHGQPPPEDHE